MIASTNAFNAAYSAATGVTLGGVSPYYRQSGPIHSEVHQGTHCHFEFWLNGNNLYACLHVKHSMHPTIVDINLINHIDDIAVPMVNLINDHLEIGVVNFPHLPGGIGHNDTHTFNILCNYNPATHANIMNKIIHSANHFGLQLILEENP